MATADIATEQQLVEQEYDRVVREDIELFRSQAAARLAGQLTDDELRPHRLRRGVYSQRQEGVHMIRTKVPGGLLTSEQMRQMAKVADEFAGGKGHLTTRQNIQYHFVPLAQVPLGKDEHDNVEARVVGAKPVFPEGFKAKEHFEIGEALGQMAARFVDEWGVKDDRTVRITLKRPLPVLIPLMARVGATVTSRPPSAMTRQISRSIGRTCSVLSTAWTSMTRSTDRSGSGRSCLGMRVGPWTSGSFLPFPPPVAVPFSSLSVLQPGRASRAAAPRARARRRTAQRRRRVRTVILTRLRGRLHQHRVSRAPTTLPHRAATVYGGGAQKRGLVSVGGARTTG